ncbi:uncharacterized protein LOC127790885 [Diospyros lotus]|uniref:uncharacterized protein LOC127790885 n=1 Tax=Diospyros lotus TaxID=55363 RepID=UPI00225C42A4|nr:uncharacterized protein LOC127790885 [Diospyros lotus]
MGKPKISTWDKLKKKMKEEFLSHNYQRLMYQRLQNLRQGTRTVDEYTTDFYQLVARNKLQETEDQLVSRYVGGLRLQIQDVFNMFDSVSVSVAHQRALQMEKQARRAGNLANSSNMAAGSSRTGGSGSVRNMNQGTGGGIRAAPSTGQPNRNNPNDNQPNRSGGNSGIRCFGCGEMGHRQSECKKTAGRKALIVEAGDEDDEFTDMEQELVFDTETYEEEEEVAGDTGTALVVCHFVIDAGSCENIISVEAVQKLNLKTKKHPAPYKMAWLKKGSKVIVSLRALFDRKVVHDSRANTYSFVFEGSKIVLLPTKFLEKIKPVVEGTNLLSLARFSEELQESEVLYVLIGKYIGTELPVPTKATALIFEFYDVFPEELPEGLPPLRDIQHQIDLEPGATLPNRPHYRMSPKEQEELRRQVEELLIKGHVRESISPCAVPALLTPKKDGSWRMCVDNRAINKITVRYRFPIPHLDDLLDQISGATIFTKLDLKSGYHQICIRPDDEWKTAFKTHGGLYEWEKFYAAVQKCVFMTPKVLFLGYVVSGDGLQVDESKIEVVRHWLQPKTLTEV